MSVDLDSARRDWAEGHRVFVSAVDDPLQGQRLQRQVEVVVEELRRRMGSTFTQADLAGVYASAETWARHVVEERAGTPGWPRNLAVVVDTAFHLHARGAVDYAP